MTFELFGASEAAVTIGATLAVSYGSPMGPFPIVVQTTGEAVPSKVRTTRWHAATRCFGERGFMLKTGKKSQAESPSSPNWGGRIGVDDGVAPGPGLLTLFQTFFPYMV